MLFQYRSMLQDEDLYPEPTTFRPERFLTQDGKLNTNIRDPATMAFGFGRRSGCCLPSCGSCLHKTHVLPSSRICPGSHIALSIMWLSTAMVLTTMKITKALDEKGVPIEAEVKFESFISKSVYSWIFTLAFGLTITIAVVLFLSNVQSRHARKRQTL